MSEQTFLVRIDEIHALYTKLQVLLLKGLGDHLAMVDQVCMVLPDPKGEHGIYPQVLLKN